MLIKYDPNTMNTAQLERTHMVKLVGTELTDEQVVLLSLVGVEVTHGFADAPICRERNRFTGEVPAKFFDFNGTRDCPEYSHIRRYLNLREQDTEGG